MTEEQRKAHNQRQREYYANRNKKQKELEKSGELGRNKSSNKKDKISD